MHSLVYITAAAAALLPATTVASPLVPRAAAANCQSPNYSVVGYGAGTTGGGSGSGTTVTSCSALTTAAKNGGVIKVSGILSGCGIVDLKSSTTVTGVGANSGTFPFSVTHVRYT